MGCGPLLGNESNCITVSVNPASTGALLSTPHPAAHAAPFPSVAEIAARVGVGEKRMRAVIREILARRMPHPPEEFVAIQLSRLNEALLVAFSAMSPTNLKAVDQVVRIMAPLRTGRLDAPDERAPAFGAARVCNAELALQDFENASLDLAGHDRPQNPAQSLEKVESTPGITRLQIPLAPLQRGEGRVRGLGDEPPTFARRIRRKARSLLTSRTAPPDCCRV